MSTENPIDGNTGDRSPKRLREDCRVGLSIALPGSQIASAANVAPTLGTLDDPSTTAVASSATGAVPPLLSPRQLQMSAGNIDEERQPASNKTLSYFGSRFKFNCEIKGE